MPHYYHPNQITDTEVIHEIKFAVPIAVQPRSRLYLLLGSGWEDKEYSYFQEECLYMKLFFPSIADWLTVFILCRNTYIVNSFRQSVEIVTTCVFLYFIPKPLRPVQGRSFIPYCGLPYHIVEEQLRVTGVLSIPGLLLVGQKCPFHSLCPRYKVVRWIYAF